MAGIACSLIAATRAALDASALASCWCECRPMSVTHCQAPMPVEIARAGAQSCAPARCLWSAIDVAGIQHEQRVWNQLGLS